MVLDEMYSSEPVTGQYIADIPYKVRCGSLCMLFGIGVHLMGVSVRCSEDENHPPPHSITITIDKPKSSYTITWTEGEET